MLGGDETYTVAVFVEALAAVDADKATFDVAFYLPRHHFEKVHHASGIYAGHRFTVEFAFVGLDVWINRINTEDVDTGVCRVFARQPMQAVLVAGTSVDEAGQIFGRMLA